MAETANISKIAEILALELFSRFLWFETGGWNQNWACVRDDHVTTKRRRKKKLAADADVPLETAAEASTAPPEDESLEVKKISTHPSDVVFFYDEPYSRSRTYINTDLKSYGVRTRTIRLESGIYAKNPTTIPTADKVGLLGLLQQASLAVYRDIKTEFNASKSKAMGGAL